MYMPEILLNNWWF